MRASSRSKRGVGALVALVAWVIAVALIWALMQGQGTSEALTGVLRVSGLTTLTLAGESALDEASIVLRNPPGPKSAVLEAIRTGSASGEAHDPRATRELFRDDVASGALTVEPVRYRVVHKGTDRVRDPWLIELSVRVTYSRGKSAMSRTLMRRHTGRVCEVRVVKLTGHSAPVYSAFALDRHPVVQVVGP